MGSGFGVDHDDGVEVGGDAVGILDDLINIRTNESGVSRLPCGSTSHSQRRVGLQNMAREVVSLSIAVWWSEDTRSTKENMPPFPRPSRASSKRGIESCPGELRLR